MAIITKTLKSTGGDYSSIVTWEAGEQTNLVTDGDSHVLECYAGTTTTGNWQADGSLDENNIIVDGWITGASNIITIKAASGSEHGGVLESGFFIKTSASSFTRVLYINDQYVNLEDIQIVQTNTSHQTRTLEIGQANCIVSRCISKTNTTNSSGRAVTAVSGSIIRNSLLVSASTGATVSVQSFTSPTYQNCTVINTSSGDGLNGSASGTGPVVTNTVCYSASGSAFSGTIDGSSDYNAGNGTTAPGANSVDNIDTSDFNNYASGDYSPSATSALIDQGTTLTGFTDDIAGNTRG